MLNFIDAKHSEISNCQLNDIFFLRKKVFKDRLDWAVNCSNEIECDEYDNSNTTYLFGISDSKVICSLRLIDMKYPNMITGTFNSYFNQLVLPKGNYLESSRFFVDKIRSKSQVFAKYPISTLLFLSALNYAKINNYDGILTIVSLPMRKIMKRSGWQINTLAQGLSEKKKPIYLLKLPVDIKNQAILIDSVSKNNPFLKVDLKEWPISVYV
ncbi:acyl-homoserine-lactone synthase [Arsenophonus sp.]|uniref:acyl-homoserine-lactone synthase n=1 Tax=Arsenophonus sp. TaxID=1872640 RepID=UPI002862730B|nr:acyl-homoserine-lactone synthase [Arsenophonus sp.]MDR5610327.1 acyl-homoserine-lactone synthase [Arsenophonus sp.]MDR5614091.1 acyl-homoserine-lactone synthase [Arsenophonus sp.]